MSIDFESLWRVVSEAPHHRSPFTIHGPDHWRRVERNGVILCSRSGANVDIVRLFALFHDSKRINEGWDPGHGKRGAEHAAKWRGELFDLCDEDFDLLCRACEGHTDGRRHDDPTIGTCWDADRLDLRRCGMIPDAKYMSTAFGAEIADYGTIYPWSHLAEPVLGKWVSAT